MSEGHELAFHQLTEIARYAEGALQVVRWTPAQGVWPYASALIALDCGELRPEAEGLPLRTRERFIIQIPSDFPFIPPTIKTPHARFAGFPHVQWKRQLCLYQATDREWSAKDGMYGFIDRLFSWLEHGANGVWEPEGVPLHPPVAYAAQSPHLIIPCVDTPDVVDKPWLGLAELRWASDRRLDIVGWRTITGGIPDVPVAPAVLLPGRFPFEFPLLFGTLLRDLSAAGVDRETLLLLLKCAIVLNGDDKPLFCVIGTAMRGVQGTDLQQHIAVWRLSPKNVESLRTSIPRQSDTDEILTLRSELEKSLVALLRFMPVEWCSVSENRPEIVTRRDHASPLSWFHGKTVSIWGCGALGGHCAEMLARAGVRKLILHDQGDVGPGVLVRQPFDDADIGAPKQNALAARLIRIRPDLAVETPFGNLLYDPLDRGDWTDGADLIIDASANRAVAEKLERVRWQSEVSVPPIISMIVDSCAQRGLVTVSPTAFTGGPHDLMRRTKLALSRRPSMRKHLNAFWPKERGEIFQPEPGCSSPTFIGSAADAVGLAAQMLNCASSTLLEESASGTVHLITQSHAVAGESGNPVSLSWPGDVVCLDPQHGYQIRISRAAWHDIQGWIRRARRVFVQSVETGGVLFGEHHEATKVAWVDDVIGPPPDSHQAPDAFICGTAGVEDINQKKADLSGSTSAYVGMWHTHPEGMALPSETDLAGMAQILETSKPAPRQAVLLIVGGSAVAQEHLGGYLFQRGELSGRSAYHRLATVTPVTHEDPGFGLGTIGLALSGGGSRAIAYHLGCLRALEDLGLLSHLQVISAVSGGSVIAGIYAFSKGSFAEFDERVTDLLRRGLVWPIAREWLKPHRLAASLATLAIAGGTSVGVAVLRLMGRLIGRFTKSSRGQFPPASALTSPLRRWWSRTNAFQKALSVHLFGDVRLTAPRRNGVEVVFNAAELRSQSAMRFGSRESGCWRFGRITQNERVSVAHAVAASAAYPALLPALDESYELEKDGEVRKERLIITDGGVYENLGLSCFDPERDPRYSYNVFKPRFIISSDAGRGIPGLHGRPFWWSSRMVVAFESVFRRVQTQSQRWLHTLAERRLVDRFIYSYLGQRDSRLPFVTADLVPREEVKDYPTDFSPMPSEDIARLSARGEMTMRILLSHYLDTI